MSLSKEDRKRIEAEERYRHKLREKEKTKRAGIGCLVVIVLALGMATCVVLISEGDNQERATYPSATPAPTNKPTVITGRPQAARIACLEIRYAGQDLADGKIDASQYVQRLQGALDMLQLGESQGEVVRDVKEPLTRMIADLNSGTEAKDAKQLGEICSVYR